MKFGPHIIAVLLFSVSVQAEESHTADEPPPYKLFRAAEDYSYLAIDEGHQYEYDRFDPIKYISLSENREVYLTFGGEFRPRYEYFKNRNWAADADEGFYSQRISGHAILQVRDQFRFVTELYHGYNSGDKEFVQYDELDWHQAYAELNRRISGFGQLSFRLGRQEMAFGAARLVGIREGPNIRRTFDAARASFTFGGTTLDAFYGREVRPEFYVFDNDFVLFDSDSGNPELWGVYTKFTIPGDVGETEAYYLGFQVDSATFNDVTGKETRHTVGIRRLGTIGERWRFNTELIYQFGDIASQSIRAYNVETDWYYDFVRSRWSPSIGLKLELTSGDSRPGDGEVNSFNPMFVNPAYYSLALTITPVNLISVHPSLTLRPSEKLTVYLEWARFWRESKNDGLYSPPRFLTRDGIGVPDRRIGSQFGLKIGYEFNRHLSFDLDLSYFIAEDFLEATGDSENILHIAPTFSFRF